MGSPPRVRGKAACNTPEHKKQGITPACAGKSHTNLPTDSCTEDHPRVCGEKDKEQWQAKLDVGSPPRVRGKGRRSGASGRATRITPACAGKSSADFPLSSSYQDHPRVCGEKFSRLPAFFLLSGSPPRVRGKDLLFLPFLHLNRITPACAGKSILQLFYPLTGKDHPRVCGEKCDFADECTSPLGSPPRVRGKVLLKLEYTFAIRITPACAGKRKREPLTKHMVKDHPRVCGEKTKKSP